MKMLESVKSAMRLFPGSFINYNNEIILIPKFNVYTMLDDVETDDEFKVKLCEWFSRECCVAMRYSQEKRLNQYWAENTRRFNTLCGTDFTVDNMELIYQRLGNGINHNLAVEFVERRFDLSVLKGGES